MVVKDVIGVLVGVLVIAGLAVAVSKNSNTASVLGAGSQGFATIIGAATKPVTG